jgi:hypothetical protein
MCEVEFVVLTAVILPDENLDLVPHTLNGICVWPGVWIDELDAVVNSWMRVTLSTDIAVRTPAFANDRGARFDPVTYDGH